MDYLLCCWTYRTGSAADIVESKLSNPRVKLEEEGERLTNATGSTKDGDLGVLCDSISTVRNSQRSAPSSAFRSSKKPRNVTHSSRGGRECSPLDGAEHLTRERHDG